MKFLLLPVLRKAMLKDLQSCMNSFGLVVKFCMLFLHSLKNLAGWQFQQEIEGLQFVFTGNIAVTNKNPAIVPLLDIHVEQMIELARLTKPGPFGQRTIDFGFYHGIFENDQLVAMTGQRLHVGNCTEISAVCTHPDHTGKGYAYALIEHQPQIILQQGQQPFLHVRADNERAIALYQRMGFTISRSMNFYFMKRR